MRWILLSDWIQGFYTCLFLPFCSINLATFLGSHAALQVSVGTIVATAAGFPLFLQQLVHPLDDALQGLVHIQPHFLLNGQQVVRGEWLSRRATKMVCWRSPTHSSSCQSCCSELRLLRPLHVASRVSWSLRRITWSESAEGDDLEAT